MEIKNFKFRCGLHGLLLTLLHLILPVFAWAVLEVREPDIIREIEKDLKEEVTNIVHAYDVGAFVFVQIVPKLDKQEILPGTPYLLKDRVLRNPAGRVELSKIKINIVTRLPEIPESLNSMIRRSISYQKVEIKIQRDPYPVELSEKSPPSSQPIDSRIPEWIRLTVDNISRALKPLLYSFLGLSLLSLLYMIFSDSSKRGLLNSFANNLTAGFKEISAAAQLLNEKQNEGSGSSKNKSYSNEPNSSQVIFPPDFFPIEILTACLADCYWSQLDQYASFLWKQISSSQKKDLIQRLPFLFSYSSYLSDVQEENLGWINESAYLSPLPIEHLNNEMVTKVVKSYPSLIVLLPSVRLNALSLSAKERIKLTTLNANRNQQQNPPAIEWEEIPISIHRQLKKKWKIEIKNIEEETEILSASEITDEYIESVPSLGWLLHLDGKEIETILSRFTARELAIAWIGPREILDQLGNYLPKKKLELLQEYLPKETQSRTSKTYLSIHQLTTELLLAKRSAGTQIHEAA